MTAEIDGIDDNWSSKAAAMDAFTRIDHQSPFVAIWLDESGAPKWSKANLSFEQQAALTAYLTATTQLWARNILDTAR